VHAWQVLLIGGASASGKTTAAREIGRRTSTPVLMADDLRLALQRVTAHRELPLVHQFLDPGNPLWTSPQRFRDALIDVAGIVSHALTAVIENHLDQADEVGPLVIEGDGILPGLANGDERVRGIIVVESDLDVLRGRMIARDRGAPLSAAQLDVQAAGSALFSIWLEAEARRLSVPTIRSAPIETLADRILAGLDSRRG
jgi:2-phosphoglycerate kinase